jgi:chromate transporter
VDYFTISQCLPGIIAVNTAIFIGNKVKGAAGGVCAALGVVFPSLVIITAIAAFLNNFAELAVVQSAFAGIRACVVALIVNALVKLGKGGLYDAFTVVICAAVFVLVMFTDMSPIVPVVCAGLAGLFAQWRKGQAGDSK